MAKTISSLAQRAQLSPQARNPATAAEPQQPHLDRHAGVLSDAWDRLVSIGDRLEGIANRVVGAVDGDGASGTPTPSPTSMVEKLDAAGQSIHVVITRIESAIGRLERL